MGQRGACARKRLFEVHGRLSLTGSPRFGYGSPSGVAAPEPGNRRWTGEPPLFGARSELKTGELKTVPLFGRRTPSHKHE